MADKSGLAQRLGEDIGGHSIGRHIGYRNAFLLHLLANIMVADINMLGGSAVGRVVALRYAAGAVAEQIYICNGSDVQAELLGEVNLVSAFPRTGGSRDVL